jgi:tetratricopeptide (TPR) repeat protein
VRSIARVKRARPQTAKAIGKPQAINLLITTKPAECDIYINDERSGATNASGNFEVDLLPDVYTLRLAKIGYVTREVDIEVERGMEDQQVNFTLEPALKTLKITTEPPEAEVYLDDAYKGVSNLQGLLLVEKVNPMEPHVLRAKKNGFTQQMLPVEPNTLEVKIKLPFELTTLRVSTEPPEAEVYLDEVYKGASNTDGLLLIEQVNLRQPHTLRVRKEGYTQQTTPVPLDNPQVKIVLPTAPVVVSLNEVRQSLAADRLADALRAYGQLVALKPDHLELPRLMDAIMQRLQARTSKLLTQVGPYGVAISAEQAAEMYELYEHAGKWQRDNPVHESFTAYWDVKRRWAQARTRPAREKEGLLLNTRAEAQRLSGLNLRDPNVHYDLGWFYREAGDNSAAIKSYNEAQTLYAGWAYPHFALAAIDMSAAEKEVTKNTKGIYYQRAIDGLSKAVNLKPDFSTAYALRSIAYAILNQHPEAIASGRQAVDLNPDSAYARYALGFAYYQKGYDKDKREYRYALNEFDEALILKEDELDEGTKESIRQKIFLMRRALGIKPAGN